MPIGSVGGQHGGMKKKTPTDPMPMGATSREQVGHVQSTEALPVAYLTTKGVEDGRGYEYY